MKNLILLLLICISCCSLNSQNTKANSNNVKRYFHKNGNISMETWYGSDKKKDSIKTFHKTGKLDEAFYYLNGRLQGNSYKYNRNGEKVTTWNFNNGRLVERTDHIMQFNKKNEEKIKDLHNRLKVLNANLIANPSDTKSRYKRSYIRGMLGDRVLALNDLNWRIYRVKKTAERRKIEPSNKALASIYDSKAWIYAYYDMKNHASHYMYKAVKSDPENARLLLNLGAYLYRIKSYKLSEHFLNKALKISPKHAFVHRVLASLQSDFEDYEKAKYHIDIAFPREKNLIKYGHGAVQRDIRTLRGFILHNLNDSENGIIDLKEAIRLNENNSYAHRNIGAVYYEIGEYELACQHLQKAKNLDYEIFHEKDDLQAYLELSCENAALAKNITKTIEPKPIEKPKLTDKPFVYPNPTKGIVNIKNLAFKDYKYLVFDHTGKRVAEGESKNSPIDISQLPTGVYIFKAVENNLVETFRLIKE